MTEKEKETRKVILRKRVIFSKKDPEAFEEQYNRRRLQPQNKNSAILKDVQRC